MDKHTYIIGGVEDFEETRLISRATVESNKKPRYRKMAGFLFLHNCFIVGESDTA